MGGEAVFKLPCGYVDVNDKEHREVEVAKLKGRVRKAIARQEVRSNPVKILDTVLSHCVVRIGEVKNPKKSMLDGLVTGDRDFIVLKVRQLSMGDTVEVEATCPGCNHSRPFTLDLKEVEVVMRDEPDDGSEADIYWNKDARAWCFKVENPALKVFAEFRLPTGFDQEAVAKYLRSNPVEANYRVYAGCLLEWNSEKGPFDLAFIEDLDLDVLDYIEDQFRTRIPGVEGTHQAECEGCAREFVVTLESSDFLFRSLRQRPKKTSEK